MCMYFVVNMRGVCIAFDLTRDGRAVLAENERNLCAGLLLRQKAPNEFALRTRNMRIPRFHKS